ncbi:ssk1 response regulator receiver [Puccinia graminis f. sp. tritici]|uniref:Ssk1 response regulator receiver n=1 Tax=Puccinia graminis f. sp. tritici TaxID=56615 RepID=A0A5B0NL44_PUCGR|nr:ssk1 response regulator receiver [Puccinia graminis f. sp. tritici]KAA1090045.1 ssk1 response regulator receiver [Puccinia graminis f. sp. tritici]
MSSSVAPSPPPSPLHHHQHQQKNQNQNQNQNQYSTTSSPSNERRDPFRSFIKPFLKRGTSTTFESIKDHLKLNNNNNNNNSTSSKPASHQHHPSASASASASLPPSQLTSANLTKSKSHQVSQSLDNSSASTHTQTRQKISRARQAASLKFHALSSLSSRNQNHKQTSSTSTENSSLTDLELPSNRNHHHHHHHHERRLSADPTSILLASSQPMGSLTASSSRPSNSIVSMTSSIHSLLTQPALVTLAQLAPAQLLSGVHSSCFGSSDAFRIFDEYELSQNNQYYRQSSNEPSPDEPASIHQTTSSNPSPRHLPTTIEQLSASSIALPITSISSIWRLLNCIEWINIKERQLITDDPNIKISYNSYSTHTPSLTPSSSQQQQQQQQQQDQQIPDNLTQGLGSFDLANTLQHVGDILSAISSESQVEIVFYHIFYPPRPEAGELGLLNAAREQEQQSPDHHFSFSSEYAHTHHSTEPASRPNIDPSPETPNPFLGAGADGEGGLREISVKADEKGLIIGLTCLLRQILYRAKRSSTIEVGLHLTPLHSQAPSEPSGTEDQRDPVPATHQEDPSMPDNSVCTSWKCVFDVSLMPPLLPKSSSPQTMQDTQNESNLSNEATVDTKNISSPDPDADRRASIGAQLRASATLARLRMSSNLTSELPLCPEESLSKIIFEKLLGMKLSTGRLTSSGHSWKVTGIFGKGIGRESDDADGTSRKSYAGHSQASVSAYASVTPSREPTADELTKFAETTLKGKKAVFFAAEQSIFAKHITTYLTSWNIDVSHMPYEKGEHDPSNSSAEMSAAVGANGAEKPATSGPTVPPSSASSRSIRSNNFIIIDDDVTTLKAQLLKLKASPTSLLHLSAHVLPNQPSQRPLMSRRMKSSNQIERFEGPPKQIHTSVIHFTSISNFRKVQDIIRKHLNGVQWVSIPDILVIPKPIGPRRILTALHTALSRPITEPQFVPIATSPSSPGTPHYLNSTSHPLGSSQLGKASPANYLGVTDFDTAAANHLKNDANLGNENPSLARQPSIQNLTPPGLRTPGTAPGTPGVPSPALLSHEALEYFSKAATENGGSSSTGVVLQSPDGRPQAMFFHHSGSSNRLRNELFNHSIHGALQSSHMSGSTSGKPKLEGRSSSSRPMLREMISVEPNTEPMTLAQQVMASAESTARTQSPSSLSNAGSNDPTAKSDTSTPSNQNRLGQSVRSSHLSANPILGDPPDSTFPHAIALAQYEAISPKTPSLPFPEGLYAANQQRQSSGSSSHSVAPTPSPSTAPVTPNVTQTGLSSLTKEQQQVLLNPRPLPMLRMPSIPANLPTSISVTLSSPRRRPTSQLPSSSNESACVGKSRSQHSPPVPTHRPGVVDEHKSSSTALGVNEIPSAALSKSASALIAASRRSTSMGDSMIANRLGRRRVSRKPTTALVPPINVLIVEDNRINQTILTTFMRKKSVKYDVAMNGQEAVDKWRTGSFHLVLMDLQLPVKDGIEATKEIREAERSVNINAFANTPPAVGGNTPPALVAPNTMPRMTPHNVSVIIVALTASSLDVDREVALAAGCNDFLTKPVSLAWLEKKLLEWGSMAWLSGFSRPNISTNSLNRSLPASVPAGFGHPPPAGSTAGAGFYLGAGGKPMMSFTGTLAQKKAKEVADHLHLSSDKARGAQIREKARLESNNAESSSTRDSLENTSDLSGTDDDANIPRIPAGETQKPADSDHQKTPTSAVQLNQIIINSSPSILNDDAVQQSSPKEISPSRPIISLQTPTPERFDSFPAADPFNSSSSSSHHHHHPPPHSTLDANVDQVLLFVNNNHTSNPSSSDDLPPASNPSNPPSPKSSSPSPPSSAPPSSSSSSPPLHE